MYLGRIYFWYLQRKRMENTKKIMHNLQKKNYFKYRNTQKMETFAYN